VDLESIGIAVHIPMVRIKIPGCLMFPEGQVDFRLLPGAVALTMEQIIRATGFVGEVTCWKVVENLTSFERVVASSGETEGIVWVPGFAPTWWIHSVSHLVSMTKALGKVACDPDPAGLLIASMVGEIWEKKSLVWDPWFMDQKDFENKGNLVPMTEVDLRLLDTFNNRKLKHPSLVTLAKWLEVHKVKSEQESFVQ